MNCLFCGKEFSTEGKRNPTRTKYCSSNCRNLYYYYHGPKPSERRTLITAEPRNCIECGKKFTPDAKHAFAQRCSLSCNSIHQHAVLASKRKVILAEKLSIPRICSVCGKEYIPYHWQQTYCSNECRIRGMNANGRKYAKALPVGVKAARHQNWRLDGNWIKAMERDSYKCQMCGTTQNARVHHLDAIGEKRGIKGQGNNVLGNLIVLCEQCHKDIHGIFLVKVNGEWRIKGKVFEKLDLHDSIKLL